MLLLVVLGLMYVFISSYIGNQYLAEVHQRLYGGLATSVLKELKPYTQGEVNETDIKDIMHSTMIMNPSAEVYLLDPDGKIITHAAPKGRVKAEKVSIKPIKEFIEAEEKPFIIGDDPRHPGTCKVFSAAPILEEGNLTGYLYIILASEEQAAVTSGLFNTYMAKLGGNMFFFSLICALLLGLLAIWFLTKNLNTIIDTVRRFKEGDLNARISKTDQGDFAVLATTYNEMADTIVANIDQLKSVENLRRELIANVSHDLRTPLAIVKGYVETLLIKEENISKEDRVKYLETSMSSLEKLEKLIAQLFEYSKLEAKQIEPEKEPFFISELAQDVAANYQVLAKSKNIKIELNQKKNLPLVFADVSLVERVIQNLMDNALKFTPEGGTIQIDVASNKNNIEIRVKDTGPGIPESEQSQIFDRYRQAERTGHKQSGTGLGLAIVKKILELHDTSIQVTSELNVGTAFMFQLPTYQRA